MTVQCDKRESRRRSLRLEVAQVIPPPFLTPPSIHPGSEEHLVSESDKSIESSGDLNEHIDAWNLLLIYQAGTYGMIDI